MNTTESRREFEEWAKDNHAYLDLSFNNDTDAYRLRIPQISWEAWQAAREQITEQRDRLAEALWNMLNQEHGSAIKAGILLRSLNLQYLNPNKQVEARQ